MGTGVLKIHALHSWRKWWVEGFSFFVPKGIFSLRSIRSLHSFQHQKSTAERQSLHLW